MPRATPRAALRTSGPQTIPSSFVAAPSLSVYGRFRRGYASETGERLIVPEGIHLTVPALPKERQWLIDGTQMLQSTMWLSLVVVSLVTSLLSRLAKKV